MKILFYEQHPDAPLWLNDLRRALPDAEVREWHPGDTAPADYAIVWRPPREVFAGRTDLKAIFNLGAGADGIVQLEREQPGSLPSNALVVRLEDSGMAQQMVEYATFAVLRYLRRFDEYDTLQRDNQWVKLKPHARAEFTVGVMGLGVLGAKVAQALVTLGVPVRGFSRSPKHIEGVSTFAGAEQFDAFISGARMLINLLPHTASTEGILNRRVFDRLAPGAYIVNVARGAHVVDDDLLHAMRTGQVAAAMLDVFHKEPLSADHPFWTTPRISITPHTSAITLREESVVQVADKIHAHARGEPISGIVDIKLGY